MTRVHQLSIHVEFGDCDPAGIVWFPNFFRWFDAGSRRFFIACGVPTWKELEKTTGIIGTPLVDTRARFVKPASYGDEVIVETSVPEWRGKSFVMRHRILRAIHRQSRKTHCPRPTRGASAVPPRRAGPRSFWTAWAR